MLRYAGPNPVRRATSFVGILPRSTLPPLSVAGVGNRRAISTPSEWETAQEDGPNQRARPPPKWFQRPIVWVLGLMPVLTLGLGVWQIKRLRWKLDLIDEMESKLKREPLSLPKNVE